MNDVLSPGGTRIVCQFGSAELVHRNLQNKMEEIKVKFFFYLIGINYCDENEKKKK